MASVPITLRGLKEFCDNIPEEDLDDPVVVDDVEGSAHFIIILFSKGIDESDRHSLGYDTSELWANPNDPNSMM